MPAAERPAMFHYWVSTDVAGALPWSWAEQRLVGNKNYWIVTASTRSMLPSSTHLTKY